MIKRIRTFRVEAALDEYDRRLPALRRRLKKLNGPSGQFLKEFSEHCGAVIRPMMHAVGKHLEARGHGYRIVRHRLRDREERKYRAGITMAIHPRGQKSYGSGVLAAPSISFLADGRGQVVWTCVCQQFSGEGNALTHEDSFALSALDSHTVERQLVDSIDGILNPDDLTPAEMEARRRREMRARMNAELRQMERMQNCARPANADAFS